MCGPIVLAACFLGQLTQPVLSSYSRSFKLQYVLNERPHNTPLLKFTLPVEVHASSLQKTAREWPRRNREWRCVVHGARWTNKSYQRLPFRLRLRKFVWSWDPFFYSEAHRTLLIVCAFTHWSYCPFSAVQGAIFLHANSSTLPWVRWVRPILMFVSVRSILLALLQRSLQKIVHCSPRQVGPGPRRIVWRVMSSCR